MLSGLDETTYGTDEGFRSAAFAGISKAIFAARVVKLDQYARAGIPFYWRVELTATRIPVVYTYLLDSASRRYRDSDVFTGVVKASVPFLAEIDLSTLA